MCGVGRGWGLVLYVCVYRVGFGGQGLHCGLCGWKKSGVGKKGGVEVEWDVLIDGEFLFRI